ncbi:Vegetative incompatibility protein HET-E-1 [Colletotrichum tropicale]|nr:Vegetative incompatibility protein HET-E-1 [Colletotrichum tropicale]
MAEVLVDVYRDVLDFHYEAFKYFQQPMLKQIYHATWKTYKTKFSDLIHNIDQHKLLILSETTLAQARRSRELETERKVQQRSDRECDMRERIIGWLQGADLGANVKNDHAKLLKIRSSAPSSGRWLLSKPEFNRWFGPFPSIPTLLWINGIPGAGKTVLASMVVEEARALSHNPTVLYFYCKADNSEKDNFVAIGRRLLLQLLEQNPELLYYFNDKYSTRTEATLSTISDLEELLETGIKNTSSVYIILDGIDECRPEETKAITRWFRKLVEDQPQSNPDQMRCMFVSQDDRITRSALGDLSTLKIRTGDNLDDISQFSARWALVIQERFRLQDEERDSIAQRVPNVCGGMFLLAKLICENLYEQASVDDLYEELQPNTFPQAIDEAYGRIMVRLSSHAPSKGKTDYCLLLLGWIVCAKRPLKWCEIQTARSIDLEAQAVNLDRYSFRDGPKDICGSLVEEDETGTVELVHLTAKQ